jgi:hypothetical protein
LKIRSRGRQTSAFSFSKIGLIWYINDKEFEMAKIVFRGKTYKSIFDMPDDVRRDYRKSKSSANTGMASGTFSSNLDNVPPIVKDIYERVQSNLGDMPSSATPLDNLPKAVDMYSRAPMERSDESIYEPAPPLVSNPQDTIEPDTGVRRLVLSLFLALLVGGAVVAVYFGL